MKKNNSVKEKSSVVKKMLSVFLNALVYLFIAICLFGVIVSIASKKDEDGTATIFGVQMRSVISPSMEKCDQTDVSGFEIKDIKTKSVVFIKVVPESENEKNEFYASLKVGDVLTFKYTYVTQETITHRITSITKKDGGGYIIELEGDNKNTEDGVLTQVIDTSDVISPNYVIGKVTATSYLLGLFIYALKSPIGLICLIILPSIIIMILEIVKIVNVLGAEKKKKLQNAEQELKLLREKLKQLEGGEVKVETPESAPTQSSENAPEEVVENITAEATESAPSEMNESSTANMHESVDNTAPENPA